MPGGLFHVSGNPESDGTWTYTWEKGRQLKKMQSVDTDASFVYNESGLRVQKTVNGVVTNYTLHGKDIKHMTQGSDNLHFFYDASNKPAIVEFNGIKYAYVHNLQGDIVSIVDSTGSVVVYYKYDAWGRPISKMGSMKDTLGALNPFRYRGYVYDEETGVYYLCSRYYDCRIARFLCTDIKIPQIGLVAPHNLFSYCDNQPVSYSDDEGTEKTLVIYYYFKGSQTPLHLEAYNSPYFDAYNTAAVEMVSVKTAQDFIDTWNSIEPGQYSDIYLYLHGSAGYLQFAHDQLGLLSSNQYNIESELDTISISGNIYDFACYSAARLDNGTSVAEVLAKKAQTSAYACDVGVSYRYSVPLNVIRGENWYARTEFDHEGDDHWWKLAWNPISRSHQYIKFLGTSTMKYFPK